jgi:DNA-directed RNA polymerase specialized sigma subunit
MNNEDAKKELEEYLNNKTLIEALEKDLEELITRATSTSKEISDMPKGSPIIEDKMAELASEIIDMKNEKCEQIIKMYKSKSKIERKINQLSQPFKNILYFRYIKGMKLEDIADKIVHLEYKYTCTLHGEALQLYREL